MSRSGACRRDKGWFVEVETIVEALGRDGGLIDRPASEVVCFSSLILLRLGRIAKCGRGLGVFIHGVITLGQIVGKASNGSDPGIVFMTSYAGCVHHLGRVSRAHTTQKTRMTEDKMVLCAKLSTAFEDSWI